MRTDYVQMLPVVSPFSKHARYLVRQSFRVGWQVQNVNVGLWEDSWRSFELAAAVIPLIALFWQLDNLADHQPQPVRSILVKIVDS